MRFEASGVISRPIEQVFAFVADFENDTKWRQGHLESQRISTGPIGVGTKTREVIRSMGMQSPLTLEVTEYEPNKRVAFAGTKWGPMEPKGVFHFLQADGGTKVTFIAEPKITGVFNLFSPLMSQFGKGDMKKSLAKLKAALESGT